MDIFSRIAQEEGLPEDTADFARSTFQQESGGRIDAGELTSSAGAVGPMQMMPATFKAYARPGERLENPMDNARVAMRYIGDLYKKTGGDPAKMAVGYFSGEGNIAKGRSPTPFLRDAKDTNGFPTSQYVQQVTGRLSHAAPPQDEPLTFTLDESRQPVTIRRFRQQYPQYSDLGDEQLTRALHQANYADVPFEKFAKAFGYQTTTDKAIETGKRGLGAIGDFVSGVMPRQRADIPPDLSANMPAPEADPDVLARIEQQAARRIRAPGSVMDNLIVQDPAVPMGRTPVTPQTRQRIEQAMSLPKPRAEITQRPDFVGQVGREVAGQWQRQDQLAQQTPILSGMTGRVEDLLRNAAVGGGASPDTARSIAFGQAVSGARGLPGQATESTLDFNAQSGPWRYWRDWESGVVGTTGSALSYIGRNLGADTVEQIGNSMDTWAQGRRPAVPTFADEVVSAFGSMASFYLPGVGLTKGANALSMLSPVAAKWAGAGTMAAIESAAEADQTYKTLRAQGVPHEEAARRADGTFAANLPLIGVTDRMAFFSDLKAFDDAGKLLGGNVARLAATGALTEGPLQEAPQQMIQNYFSGRPLLEGVGESALIGALVGGGMAAAGPVAMRPSREEAFANALGEQVAGTQFAPLQMPGGTAPATPADAAQVYGFAHTPQRPGGAPRIDPNTVPAWVDVNQTLGIQGPPAPPPGSSMRGELSQILSDPRSIDEITADEQRQQEEAIAESVRQAQKAQAALDAELAQQRADMQAQAAKTRQMESIAADAQLARELFAAEQAAAVARGEPEQQPLSAIQLAFQRARQQQEAPNAVQTGQQSESRVAEHQRVPQGGQVRADEGQVRQGESRQDRRRRSALERQAQQGQGGQGPVALQGEVGRAQGPTVQPVAPSGPDVAPGQAEPAATPAPAEQKPRPKLSAREQARREKLAQRQQKGSPDAATPTKAEPQQAQPTPTAGPQPLTSAAPQGAVAQPAGTVTGASPAGLSTQQGVPPSGDTKLAQEGGGAVNPDATGSGGTAAPEKARKSRGGRIRAAAEASRTGGQAPVPVRTPVAEPNAALRESSENPSGIKPENSGFDPEAFDRERAARVKASRNAGNVHLDKIDSSVESMRGKVVHYVHDPMVRGVIRTVDNRGNVYIHWSDEYSAKKEMAVRVIEPNRNWLKTSKGLPYLSSKGHDGNVYVWESSIGPSDLKDYSLTKGVKAAEQPAPAAPEMEGDRIIAVASASDIQTEPGQVERLPESQAQHIEGKQKEPATVAAVTSALKKSDRNTERDLRGAKKALLAEVDAAIKKAPSARDFKGAWDAKDRRVNAGDWTDEIGYRIFNVPGDGKFRVLNTRETLERFRKNVDKSGGFSSKDSPWKPSAPGGSAAVTIRDMLGEGEAVAAYELAKTRGTPFRFGNAGADEVPVLYTDAEDHEHLGVKFFVGRGWTAKETKLGWAAIEARTALSVGSGDSAGGAIVKARETLDRANKDGVLESKLKKAKAVSQKDLEARWLAWAEKNDEDFTNREQIQREAQAKADKRNAEIEDRWGTLFPSDRVPWSEALGKMNSQAAIRDRLEDADTRDKGDDFLALVQFAFADSDLARYAKGLANEREEAGGMSGSEWFYLSPKRGDGFLHRYRRDESGGVNVMITNEEEEGWNGVLRDNGRIVEKFDATGIKEARRRADELIDGYVRQQEKPEPTPAKEPELKIPEGYKKIGTSYLGGSVEKPLYGRFVEGDRVRDSDTGYSGVVESYFTDPKNPQVVTKYRIKYDNGAGETVREGRLSEAQRIELRGFKRVDVGGGDFELRDGNMRVQVSSMGDGKFQARFQNAKSSPHATEQSAIDWAAEYRKDATTQRATSVKAPDSLNALTNPIIHGDTIRLADGSEWEARSGYTGMGWSLVKDGKTHPQATNIDGQVAFIQAIEQANETTKAPAQPAKPAPAPDTPAQIEARIPPLYFQRTKVPVEVWIEDEGKTETVEMPAKQALDDVRRERDAYQKLLDCLRGSA